MANITKRSQRVRAVGNSWVIQLPKTFIEQNHLAAGTQVLLTFKKGDKVEAEILPPLDSNIERVGRNILNKRRKVFEELKRLGD
jgi:antitoxin component of MazEF toxin-antitoxin module